ncbi:Hypothetical predicted protein [Paramuricea clavata]|uniref:Uncharacterized protein n=1 Tax=Paramuricea clavata TaxID=317549 RepID=A0A6S7H9T0_PARCT|nr:Hypothetical predicted protein [Paramuricea clavata]
MIECPKQETRRSKAKTAVSLASRRLIGAAHRGTEYDVLKSLIIELEKAYDDFCVANEEFELLVSEEGNSEHRVVNGEDNLVSSPETSMYLNSVSSSAPPTSPSINMELTPLPVIYSTPNASETYLVNPSTVPIPSVGPQPTPHLSPNSLGFNSRVQVKKMPFPTFSGNRKEWPEFKAIWKSVAETAYQNKTALAHKLKRSVKSEASRRIRSVNVTKPEAYDVMWQKLESFYEDVRASVQAALEDLHKIKAVPTNDYKGLVELVDELESAYSQLEELGNLDILTLRDVDFITELLPCYLKVNEKQSRMAEYQPKGRRNEFPKYERRKQHVQGYHVGKQSSKKYYKCAYPSHRKDSISHTTSECKEFQKLPVSGKEGKSELLKQIKFKCFRNHRRLDCPKKVPCSCGSGQHHQLLCESKRPEENKGTDFARKETHVFDRIHYPCIPSTKQQSVEATKLYLFSVMEDQMPPT